MKRAVAYYRMSTDKQDASIPAQREAARFQQMIAEAENFEAVIVWDLFRLGWFDIRELRGERQDVSGSLRQAQIATETMSQRMKEISAERRKWQQTCVSEATG